MISAIVFILSVPLSVELLGAFYAVFDARRDADSRSAALERLAVPLAAWGGLWWLAGADAWRPLIAALVLVIACHVVSFYGTRWLMRRPGMQTNAIDTDPDDGL